MLRLLLVLNLFPSIQATGIKILVKQSPMLEAYDNTVNLTCKYSCNLFSRQFQASLHKGVDSAVEVCAVHGNYSQLLQVHSATGFNCDGKLGNESVTFYLQNLYVNQTDIYFCKIEIMYPPPYLDSEKSNGTIIHVKGKHLCPGPSFSGPSQPFWALAVVGGVLASYSLLVTVALSVFWTASNPSNKDVLRNSCRIFQRWNGPTREGRRSSSLKRS
uniref:T-cell-specific surface glycoprotein CD28 n=1 Tax=Callithrix jacchus TaxID=9483 RepID=A0A8I3WLA5_CALJA